MDVCCGEDNHEENLRADSNAKTCRIGVREGWDIKPLGELAWQVTGIILLAEDGTRNDAANTAKRYSQGSLHGSREKDHLVS